MESQSPLAYSEKGVIGLENYWVEGKGLDREVSPSINLRLGIGAPINEGRIKPIFTAEQLHELNYQALIFKYIVAGLFVPFHLVFPIWESVPCSFRSANGGNYNQYPSFLGFSSQGLNQRTMMMDPEPGRCRRTDGKKWRCTKNVVPDLKYCARHMHRGHQRSRKHVEASQNILQSDKTTKSTTPAIDCCNTSNTNTKFPIPVLPNLYLSSHSSNTKNSDSYTKRTDVSNDSKYSVNIGTETAGKTTGASLNIGATEHGTSRNNSNYIDGKDDGFIYTDNRSIYNGSKSKFARFVAPGFGSSPRSILQGGTAVGGSTLGFDNRTLLETEPNRCRRTDGKKWRCSHEVVPDHKYCGRHIHRGAKRTKVPSELVTVAAPPPTPLAIPEKANDCINLNTKLSISIPSRPQRTSSNEGHYTSASSSDATTISDENTSVANASIPSLENM